MRLRRLERSSFNILHTGWTYLLTVIKCWTVYTCVFTTGLSNHKFNVQLCGNKVDRTIYELIGHGPTRPCKSFRHSVVLLSKKPLEGRRTSSCRTTCDSLIVCFSNEPKLQRATCTVSQLRRTETQTRVLEARVGNLVCALTLGVTL